MRSVGDRASFAELERHPFLVDANAEAWKPDVVAQAPDTTVDSTLGAHWHSSLDFTFGHLLASTSATLIAEGRDPDVAEHLWADWTFLPSISPDHMATEATRSGDGGCSLPQSAHDRSLYRLLLESLREDIPSSRSLMTDDRLQEVRTRSQVGHASMRFLV